MPALHTVELCSALAGKGTVLLPRPLAAQCLRSQLAGRTLGDSTQAASPLAWSEWSSSLWSALLLEGRDDRLLLNRLQEEQLWYTVISTSSAATGLAPEALRDLASMARQALALAGEHRITAQLTAAADTADARAFAAWWSDFRERCRQKRLLSPALLEEALITHLRDGGLPLQAPLHLVGFDRFTPAQGALLDALGTSGIPLQQHPAASGLASERWSTVFPDPKQQLRSAVRLLAEHGRAFPSSSPRFALILPNPADHRPDLERLFLEWLAPELQSVMTDLASTPWHFTQQPPVASAAAVTDALTLLDWAIAPQTLDSVARLLRSPYLGGTPLRDLASPSEWLHPALLLRGRVALPELVHERRRPKAHQQTDHRSTARVLALKRFLEAVEQHSRPAQRLAGSWADVVRRVLHAAGWPGDKDLSPAEFNAVQAWEGLLDHLSSLQFDGSRLSLTGFLQRLRAEAKRMPLPSQTPDVPLQVLSLEETEGLSFDLALHLDATVRVLPPPASLHPLLPQSLQRALGLADPERAVTEARARLDSLASRSGAVYLFAAPSEEDGGAELTPLARDLGFAPLAPDALLAPETPTPPVPTEPLVDPPLPPVPEGTLLRGGVEVLRRQAACGFHAFATHRLGADDPFRTSLGLPAGESGSLLHEMMQRIWSTIPSLEALKSTPEAARRELIAAAVEQAFARADLVARGDDRWAAAFLPIARKRFRSLLKNWLATELDRSPFTVLAQEQKQELTLGPVRFSVRPDRVDLTPEGGVVLVDYKTGGGHAKADWLGSRPEAPQLLAYALCERNEPLHGITFAQVRPGKDMKWVPLSSSPTTVIHSGKKQHTADLSKELPLWREELTRLATAFAEGDTAVHPKDYPHTCKYCAHRLLCRLDPSTLLQEEDTEDRESEMEALG